MHEASEFFSSATKPGPSSLSDELLLNHIGKIASVLSLGFFGWAVTTFVNFIGG